MPMGVMAAGASVAPSPSASNPILGGGGVHHAGIRTKAWDRTLIFYQRALGFTPKLGWGAAPNRSMMLDTGDGSCVEITEDVTYVRPAPASSPPIRAARIAIYHVCFRTTRLDAVVENALRYGARILYPPMNTTLETTTGQGRVTLRWCYLEGPNGEWIELLQNYA